MAKNANRDQNFIPTAIVALNMDGKTVVLLEVNPTSHALKISDGTTGSDNGTKVAIRDENSVKAWIGVSSSDFKTPVTVYGDSNGNLLTQST